MERKYTVYIHQNQINGKRYIGITADTVQSRWRNGAGYKNQVFGRAIEKYGWENFTHHIVAQNIDKHQAEQLEIALIKEFNTQDPAFGYNIAAGGNATLPDLYKEVYQFNDKGELIAIYPSYKAAEKETGIRADTIGAVCNGKQYTAGGYIWSNICLTQDKALSLFEIATARRKESSLRGIDHAIQKISMKVQQIDIKTGQVIAEYSSQREAARRIGVNQKSISNVIKGKQKTAGGYIWRTISL